MVVTLNSATREQATAQIKEMCRRLLANPIIEDYAFELEGETRSPSGPRVKD
jgi:phosphoribosylformylglycinamidine synthase